METFFIGLLFGFSQFAVILGTSKLHCGEWLTRSDHWQLAIFTSGVSCLILGLSLILGLNLTSSNGFSLVQWIVVLLLHDLYLYGSHRLLHTEPLYQKIHWLHHLHRSPGPWTAMMKHPGEAIIEGLFFLIIPLVVPLSGSTLTGFFCFMFAAQLTFHLGTTTAFGLGQGKALSLLGSPGTHRRHHQEVSANLGAYTSIWDRLGGTYREHHPLET